MLREPMNDREVRLGWVWLAFQLLLLPSLLTWGNRLLPTPLPASTLNFLFFGVNFGMVAWIFRRFLGQALRQGMEQPFLLLRAAGQAFLVYWAATLLLALLPIFRFQNVNDGAILQMARENYPLTVIGTVFLVPVAEEVLYRGLLFGGVYAKKPWAAYLISILFFCAIHVAGYVGSYPPLLLALCFLQYLPAGFCLAWAYARSGNILSPILVHMTINAIGISAGR